MTVKVLQTRFDELEADGLPEILRHEAQNAIENRKWGQLGDWGKFKASVSERVRRHSVRHFLKVYHLMNEA